MIKIDKFLGETDDFEVYTDWYKCPNCDEYWIQKNYKYCPNCGERIEWVGEEE